MDFAKFCMFAAVLITAIAIAAGLAVFPALPESVPTHWNAAGEIDSYGPAWMGAFLFPAAMLFVLGLFLLIPRIAVFRKNLEEFTTQYWLLAAAIQVFFLAFFAATLMPVAGIEFSMNAFVFPAVGTLFVLIGLLMPSFRRNFFVGVRTPWTLASERVWDKTHKASGKAFVLAGIAVLLSAFLPGKLAIWVVLAAAALVTCFAFAYSYWLYRKIGKIEF